VRTDKRGRGGSSNADVRTFGAKKNSDFLKFNVFPHGQRERGLRQCGHFADKGNQFFAIVCEPILWTAINKDASRRVARYFFMGAIAGVGPAFGG